MENNNQKLRDAVESLLDFLYNIGIDEETASISHKDPALRELLHTDRTLKVLRKAKAALAEPRRNCDVGTPEEWHARFESFCVKHFRYANDNPCAKCPLKDDLLPCVYGFLQMPYEKGE